MPTEEPAPSAPYSLHFPVWVLCDADRLTEVAPPGFDPVTYMPEGESVSLIPVFTAWAAALHFITTTGNEDAAPLPYSRPQFVALLVDFESAHVGHAAIEIDAGTPHAQRTTASALLAAVRRAPPAQ